MMMHAYDEVYLEDAMCNLGEAIDVAVNEGNMDADEFMDLFITSGIGEQFGAGVPKYICGMSGTELFMETVYRSRKKYPRIMLSGKMYDRTAEYWSGWILAYYQWKTALGFKKIKQKISMAEILKLYSTLHEASEEKCAETFNAIIERRNSEFNLGYLRRMRGYSQRLLSDKSGVSLRMIQQYEQGAKDINKANGESLRALAITLGCSMEDLFN